MSHSNKLVLSPPSSQGNLRKHAIAVSKHVLEMQYLTAKIAIKAAKNKDNIGVASEDFLMYAGYVSMASHWLKMEETAAIALDKDPTGPKSDFYKAKLKTSRFYFDNLLPRTRTLVETMNTPVDTIM